MRIIKPEWVKHTKKSAIYSIDIHPDGKRLLTGGGDHIIKIWNMYPILREDDPSPRLLSSLESHGGAVNVVRWQPQGRYFASGSDDRIILIWEMANSQQTKVFGTNEIIQETWRVVGNLTGHLMDVSDLSWSPDGTKIVSGSLDNTLIVWDVQKFEKITILKGHSAWVRGVAWDPIGKYIASQSEDKSIIIWSTSGWNLEKRIETHSANAVAGAFFSRLSWSPDGGNIVSTQGLNAGKPSALVYKRGSWKQDIDFIGHKQPVICTRFDGKVFKNEKVGSYAICAIGSKEATLSVWSTAAKIPLVVVQELFEGGIVDIAWGRDGFSLICCSEAGEIAACVFNAKELGQPISEVEFREMLQKHYGHVLNVPSSVQLAENPLQYQLEQNAAAVAPPPTAALVSPTPSNGNGTSAAAAPVKGPVKQTEVRLADGRKRVTPLLVVSTPVMNTPPPNFGVAPTPAPTPLPPAPVSVTPPASATPPISASNSASSASNHVAPASTTEKRKAPLEENSQNKKQKHIPEDFYDVKDNGTPSDHEKNKERAKEKAKEKKEQKQKEKQREREKQKEKTKEKAASHATHVESRSAPVREAAPVQSRLSLPENKPKVLWPNQILNTGVQINVEASVTDLPNGEHVSAITCHLKEQILWEDRVKSRANLITANANFIAVGCSDGSLYIYSPSGRYLFPCITLGEPLVALESNRSDLLLAVTSLANVTLWDITRQSLVFTHSIHSLIQNKIDLKRARITDEGSTIITLSNNQSFTFHSTMKTWMRIADDKFMNSEFNTTNIWQADPQRGLLAELQAIAMQNVRPSPLLNFNVTAQMKAAETISHLEHQVASALATCSSREYVHWLKTYTRKLTDEANEAKLHEVCRFLLGPPHKTGSDSLTKSTWDPLVLGLSKRSLLNELLPLIGTNRTLQRLTNQYRDNLSQVM